MVLNKNKVKKEKFQKTMRIIRKLSSFVVYSEDFDFSIICGKHGHTKSK